MQIIQKQSILHWQFFFGKKLASINAALTLNGDPLWLAPRKWLLGISFNLDEFDWWLTL
jgi:hypothetical protein